VITFSDLIQVKHLGPKADLGDRHRRVNVLGFVILPMGGFIIQSFVAQLAVAAIATRSRFGVLTAGDRAPRPRLSPRRSCILSACFSLSLPSISPAFLYQIADYMRIRLLSIGAIVFFEALGNVLFAVLVHNLYFR